MAEESNIYNVVQKIKSAKREIVLYEEAIRCCRRDIAMLTELYKRLREKAPVVVHADNGMNIEGTVTEGSCRLVHIAEERPVGTVTGGSIIEDSCKLVRIADSPERPKRVSCFGFA